MRIRVLYLFCLIFISGVACSMTEQDTYSSEQDTISRIFPVNDTSSIIINDSLIVMQWNIGHFSFGNSPNSRITDNNYSLALLYYQDFIKQVKSDIISLNEYSTYFADTADHPKCSADSILFSSYPYQIIGNNGQQRHYSMNAIFSTIELLESETVEYKSNLTATTTSSAISPSDYYFTRSSFNLSGERIFFVSTHLFFNTNDNRTVLNQAKELVEFFNNEDYVIICGDFNTDAASLSLFTDAGYTLGNDGSYLTYPAPTPYRSLDNIIVKGFRINQVLTFPVYLSDHFPIAVSLSIIKPD